MERCQRFSDRGVPNQDIRVRKKKFAPFQSVNTQVLREVLRPGPFGGRVCDSLSQPTWALVLVRGWVGGRGPPPCPRLTVQNELGPGFT